MGARSSNRNKPQNNISDGHLLEYFRNTFIRGGGGTNASGGSGLIATGGVISDYTAGGTSYRSHIFTSLGSLVVTSGTATADFLVVGGGGAGGDGATAGHGGNGGGGAGGLVEGNALPLEPGTYTMTVGAGGMGAAVSTYPEGSWPAPL